MATDLALDAEFALFDGSHRGLPGGAGCILVTVLSSPDGQHRASGADPRDLPTGRAARCRRRRSPSTPVDRSASTAARCTSAGQGFAPGDGVQLTTCRSPFTQYDDCEPPRPVRGGRGGRHAQYGRLRPGEDQHVHGAGRLPRHRVRARGHAGPLPVRSAAHGARAPWRSIRTDRCSRHRRSPSSRRTGWSTGSRCRSPGAGSGPGSSSSANAAARVRVYERCSTNRRRRRRRTRAGRSRRRSRSTVLARLSGGFVDCRMAPGLHDRGPGLQRRRRARRGADHLRPGRPGTDVPDADRRARRAARAAQRSDRAGERPPRRTRASTSRCAGSRTGCRRSARARDPTTSRRTRTARSSPGPWSPRSSPVPTGRRSTAEQVTCGIVADTFDGYPGVGLLDFGQPVRPPGRYLAPGLRRCGSDRGRRLPQHHELARRSRRPEARRVPARR